MGSQLPNTHQPLLFRATISFNKTWRHVHKKTNISVHDWPFYPIWTCMITLHLVYLSGLCVLRLPFRICMTGNWHPIKERWTRTYVHCIGFFISSPCIKNHGDELMTKMNGDDAIGMVWSIVWIVAKLDFKEGIFHVAEQLQQVLKRRSSLVFFCKR